MTQLTIVNPATGQPLTTLDCDNADSLAFKAAAARRAQAGWAATPLSERQAVLQRFRALLLEREPELARLLSQEVGKPIAQAHQELKGFLTRFDFLMQRAEPVLADQLVYEEAGLQEIICQEPLGVIANISAWNYPWLVGCNVFVPALLAGNAVLYKPSEFASLTGLAMVELFQLAGLPADLFVPVIGAGDVGQALLEQDIDAVFFTGSWATGQRIAAAMAERLIPVQLELGGKDPVYVCEDVAIAATAAALADGAFYNNGQSCCAVERIYVHHSIYDAFVQALVGVVQGLRQGDPLDPETYLGALTRGEPQLALLQAQVADAVAKGARLECGGQRIEGSGHFFAPTVLSQVNHSMRLMREESFGPIIGVQSVADDAEAVQLMNDTEYGLTAAVYTPDQRRAEALLRQLNTGTAYWNCCDRVSPRLPWSGRQHSGLGLTLSDAGLLAFAQPRAWHLKASN